MVKIALFGTSADPPTAGHQAILRWLSERYDLVAVWAADNPLKSHQTPLEHRANMLRLLIADIESPKQNIGYYSQISSFRTIETITKAKQLWGNADFTLVIGSDLVSQLPRWFQAKDLLQQVQLLVVPRPGYEIQEHSLEPLKQLGAKVAIADLTGLDVSSTAYRKSGNPDSLTPPIEAYIHQHSIYTNARTHSS